MKGDVILTCQKCGHKTDRTDYDTALRQYLQHMESAHP